MSDTTDIDGLIVEKCAVTLWPSPAVRPGFVAQRTWRVTLENGGKVVGVSCRVLPEIPEHERSRTDGTKFRVPKSPARPIPGDTELYWLADPGVKKNEPPPRFDANGAGWTKFRDRAPGTGKFFVVAISPPSLPKYREKGNGPAPSGPRTDPPSAHNGSATSPASPV